MKKSVRQISVTKNETDKTAKAPPLGIQAYLAAANPGAVVSGTSTVTSKMLCYDSSLK